MKIKPHVNSVGACYFASNFFGWATAKTPWQALAKLDLSACRRPRLSPKLLAFAKDEVCLYYIPNEDTFAGVKSYSPVDRNDKPYGVCLYAGRESEHNEKLVFNELTAN
jgi:hypothetical protein